MKKNIFNIINAVIAILFIAGPFWLFPVCTDMNPMGLPMKCHYSAELTIGIGIGILVLTIISIVLKKKGFAYLVYIFTLMAGIFDFLAFKGYIKIGDMKSKGWEVGLCSMDGHPCLASFGTVMPILILILGLVNVIAIIYSFVKKED